MFQFRWRGALDKFFISIPSYFVDSFFREVKCNVERAAKINKSMLNVIFSAKALIAVLNQPLDPAKGTEMLPSLMQALAKLVAYGE
jgi:hypothetical protein